MAKRGRPTLRARKGGMYGAYGDFTESRYSREELRAVLPSHDPVPLPLTKEQLQERHAEMERRREENRCIKMYGVPYLDPINQANIAAARKGSDNAKV